MDVLQRDTNLREPVQDPVLIEILVLFLRPPTLLVLILELLNSLSHVAAVCIVHDNAKLTSLGLVDFFEPDDVRVVQNFENLGLPVGSLLVLLAHLLDVNLLDHRI